MTQVDHEQLGGAAGDTETQTHVTVNTTVVRRLNAAAKGLLHEQRDLHVDWNILANGNSVGVSARSEENPGYSVRSCDPTGDKQEVQVLWSV